MSNRLGSSDNGGRGSFDNLGRLIRLLLLGFPNRRSGISGRILEGSNRSRLLNLWGSLVDLGGVADLPGFRLEKLPHTSRQTATDLDGRPDGPLLFLFLLLFFLKLISDGLRGRSLGFSGGGNLCLLDWLRRNVSSLDSGLLSGGILRLGVSRGGLLSGSRGFLNGGRRRLE